MDPRDIRDIFERIDPAEPEGEGLIGRAGVEPFSRMARCGPPAECSFCYWLLWIAILWLILGGL